MYYNIFRALNQALYVIKKYNTLELCIFNSDCSFKIRYDNNYLVRTIKINTTSFCKKDLLIYLLKIDITKIQLYGSIGINYVNKIGYQYTDISANKIINAWKRYRIRTARIRNDLVLKGLAEYWFHPSKINFEL